MRQLIKRHIGQILMDGRFMSSRDLDKALEEQKYTKELLGQVLVRMGVVKERDFKVPLMVQKHLYNIDDAVKIAAGERELLGVLLVHSGHITSEQLDQAIAEQKSSGDKLGKVFIRLNMLKEQQLTALLDFQKNQSDTVSGPLRIGELLVATGHISQYQLDDAIRKQAQTHKRLGEVLVDEGYVRPSQVKYGITLQKMLVGSVLASIISLGMGSSGFASDVVLQWDASPETAVTGYKVYSSPGSTPLDSGVPIDVQKQTTATVTGLDPGVSHQFAVTAYDASGSESNFSNIVSVPEQTPPTVAITSPANAITVSGIVSISVNAADNVGITKVEYYVNGVLKSTDTGAPYVYSWDTTALAAGAYTLAAKAYDAAGNVSQSATSTVTVVKDITPPTVAVTSPVNNAVISGTVTINSSASDNVGVSKVEFYINNVFMAASNVSPYSYSWDSRAVANGNYTIIAKAYDNAGNSQQSSSVGVTVNNPVSDVTAPTLNSFALPATSTSLTVPVTGFSASDNIAVTGYMITESSTPPAAGASGWSSTPPASFTFSSAGTKTAYAWAKDAAGNVSGSRAASVTITLTGISAGSILSAWPATTVPGTVDSGPDNAVELGVKFRSDTPGSITGIRFYKAGTNTGTHIGNLWDSAGKLLATATFSNETASGWQQVKFATPVAIAANTVYVASYHTNVGHYSDDQNYFAGKGVDNGSLHLLADGVSGASGVYSYGTTSKFPNLGWKSSNYWVDVLYSSSSSVTVPPPDVTAPTLNSFALPTASTSLTVPVTGLSASDNIAVTGYMVTESSAPPAAGAAGWRTTPPASFTFSSAGTKTAYAWAKDAAGNVSGSRAASVTITLPDTVAPAVSLSNLAANSTVSGTVAVTATATDNVGVSRVEFYVNGVLNATDTSSPYTFNWNTASVANGPYTLTSKAYDAAGNVGQSAAITVTVDNPVISAGSILSAWSATTVPGTVDSGPDSAVELGVKFRSDIAGSITGVRFYKAGTNTGTHIGNLWDSTGKLLATATFRNETASGWQQVNFATPVAIAANTVYVASYHTNVGHYSDDQNYFAGKGVDNGSLHLLADGVSGASGVYSYGTTSKFPNLGWKSSNYWVDVLFKK